VERCDSRLRTTPIATPARYVAGIGLGQNDVVFDEKIYRSVSL
jgi:hypothetical protein